MTTDKISIPATTPDAMCGTRNNAPITATVTPAVASPHAMCRIAIAVATPSAKATPATCGGNSPNASPPM